MVGFIQEYSIEKKLEYFVFDNATSNDTCVKTILKVIWPNLFKKKQKFWYVGHIINLVTQVFLYNKDEEAFTANVQGTWSLIDDKKQFEV